MQTDFQTPNWVHHAVFYEIFPDRFASSDKVQKPHHLEPWDSTPTPMGFKGGDLLGAAERLDYLQDLGIDAVYFTPVFQSASNHRYHTHDYYQVDPILGGNNALKHFLHEAHRRNIKVVLDGVFNHASRGFFQFNHILECGSSSPYLDWFTVYGYPLNAYWGKPNYKCWANLAALPTFNHKNPQVVEFIYTVARYWLDFGIDGWRLDVAFEFGDDAFWQGFREIVKRANPQAYITGEIVEDASQWLQGDQLDGVMNYLMAYCAWGFFGGYALNQDLVGDNWRRQAGPLLTADTAAFARNVESLLGKYPRPAVLAQLNMLDSHDTARLLSLMGGDMRRLKLATLFQMTYPGAPCVYYGNEIGMEGGKDPDCRRTFPRDEKHWNKDLLAYFKQLIALRKQYRSLRDGSFRTLYADDGVVAILREWQSEKCIVVFNRLETTLHLDLNIGDSVSDGIAFHDELNQADGKIESGRLCGLNVPPMTGALLVLAT